MIKFAVIYNTKNSKSGELSEKILAHLKEKGGSSVSGDSAIPLSALGEYDYSGCDFAVALGGDGTMLAVARYLSTFQVPLAAVNMGKVGFLSTIEPGDAFTAADRMLAGDYEIQERLMLAATLKRAGRQLVDCMAFNEVVVSSGINCRAVMLDLFLDQEHINLYHADGIIVSTPTGSTGYSLSAGGPIVMEELDTALITPICPHSFFSRPIVASADSEVKIINRNSSHTATLTADGQFRFTLAKDDVITITRHKTKARIIHFSGDSYFDRIKRKLYI